MKAHGAHHLSLHPAVRHRVPAAVAAVLAAGVLLLGCGKDTASVGTGSQGTTSATAQPGSIPAETVPPGPPKGTAGPPILELDYVCYGACAYEVPTGLPAVVLYDDGTLVLLTHTRTWGDPPPAPSPRVWTASRLTIGASEVAELTDIARHAGLVEGGVHNNGTNEGFADGGGSIFVARLDGKVTTIEAPQLYGDDEWGGRTSDHPAERAQLLALQKKLSAYEKDARTTPFPIDTWALVAHPEGAVTGGEQPTPTTWTGTALASLPDAMGDGARCGTFADATLAAAVPSMVSDWAWVADAGQRWTVEVRPLLPHQHSCAEVQAGLDDVHAAELSELIKGAPIPRSSAPGTTVDAPPTTRVS